MVTDAAQWYSAAFAPELFVLVCILCLVGYEWREASAASLAGLGARIGGIGLGWAIAFVVYQGLPRLVETVPSWGPDATGSAGLGLGMLVIWGCWRVRDWGHLIPEFSLLLLGVTVPHLLITPFWDVSSHVLYAAVPAGYLFLVTVRFVPFLLVGLGMVVARPLAGAHTWPESIGGLVLSVVALVVLVQYRTPEARRPRIERGPT